MAANSLHFSPAAVAHGRFVVLGPGNGVFQRRLCDAVRSLQNSEVISAGQLLDSEVRRGSSAGAAIARARQSGVSAPDHAVVAILRHWFWSRRTGPGFLLVDFPATVAQAMIFDIWLEERGLTLDAVLWTGVAPRDRAGGNDALRQVAPYYRGQGLLVSIELSPEADAVDLAMEQLARRIADR
jgi:adenylate kinase